MVAQIKHTFQSSKGDGPDIGLVKPSDWNAAHSHTMPARTLWGNPNADEGAAQEIPLGAGLAFNDGTIYSAVRAIPVGAVLPLAGNYEPPGWFICDGRAVSRTTYSVLYSITGTKFGSGDGSTTFNIPDMRGRVPAGKDNLGGISANRLTPATIPGGATDVGKVAGTERHVLTVAELAAHDHTIDIFNGGQHRHLNVIQGDAATSSPSIDASKSIVSANNANLTYRLNGSTAEPDAGRSGLGGIHTHGADINDAGSSEPHLNLQPMITMNYVIFTGVY